MGAKKWLYIEPSHIVTICGTVVKAVRETADEGQRQPIAQSLCVTWEGALELVRVWDEGRKEKRYENLLEIVISVTHNNTI